MKQIILALMLAVAGIGAAVAANPIREGNMISGHVLVKGSEENIIRKSKFPQNPKRSVRFSGKRTKRSVQKRKARNTQKAETKVL